MVLANRHWVIEERDHKLCILPFEGIHGCLWFGISNILFVRSVYWGTLHGIVLVMDCTIGSLFVWNVFFVCFRHFLNCGLCIEGAVI